MKNLHVTVLCAVLVMLAAALMTYKVRMLELPVVPEEETSAWHVEARIDFQTRGRPAKIGMFLPTHSPNFTRVDEDFVAGRFGLSLEAAEGNRRVEWSTRRPKQRETLYYRALVHQERDAGIMSRSGRRPSYPEIPQYSDAIGAAVTALLEDVRSQSADTESFTRVLLQKLYSDSSDSNVLLIRDQFNLEEEDPSGLRQVLAGARIPSRISWGLLLEDGRTQGRLQPWLEVWDGAEWLFFDPRSGSRGAPANMMLWYSSEQPFVSSQGVHGMSVDLAVRRSVMDAFTLAKKKASLTESRIMDFSLLALPLQTQNVYRVLLLIPVGALMVVLLRNVVGISTFGTFMPVLIALAFRETNLAWGIVLFLLLMFLGLSIRFYLEELKLLLVPRLAAVLTVVVLLMAGISIISNNLELERGLSIALFPMVIIAMTIERASIIWEEHGAADAFKQGLGTLLTAILGYLAMFNEYMEHLIFVFPELLLVILAACLAMGRYSGYRLTELYRFRGMLQDKSRAADRSSD